jgi:hypothetical protein
MDDLSRPLGWGLQKHLAVWAIKIHRCGGNGLFRSFLAGFSSEEIKFFGRG